MKPPDDILEPGHFITYQDLCDHLKSIGVGVAISPTPDQLAEMFKRIPSGRRPYSDDPPGANPRPITMAGGDAKLIPAGEKSVLAIMRHYVEGDLI